MSQNKVIDLKKKILENLSENGQDILSNMSEDQARAIIGFILTRVISELKQGLSGEIEYKDSPIFELIDRLYQGKDDDPVVGGCYFCDPFIDGNETEFNYPENTNLCLSCQVKAANILVAFGIDHQVLFPGMSDRKIQSVLFDEVQKDI